jgi:hypothetical protein
MTVKHLQSLDSPPEGGQVQDQINEALLRVLELLHSQPLPVGLSDDDPGSLAWNSLVSQGLDFSLPDQESWRAGAEYVRKSWQGILALPSWMISRAAEMCGEAATIQQSTESGGFMEKQQLNRTVP